MLAPCPVSVPHTTTMVPIVIHQSRWKLATLFVLFSALTLVLAFMTFVSAFLPDLWSYLGVTLFAPIAIACAIAAISSGMSYAKPGTLTADADGLRYRTFRHDQRWHWDEIAKFIVFAPSSRLRSPGCELKNGVRKFVSFGRSWEKTPEEIVEALKETKEAVAGSPLPTPSP